MKEYIFFFPTRYRFGGACIVSTLQRTLAARADKQDARLRECCLEHVRYWEESQS